MTKKDYDEIKNEILPANGELEIEVKGEMYAIYPCYYENEGSLFIRHFPPSNSTLLEIKLNYADGVSKQAIEKLFSAPCFDGKSIDDLKDEIKIIGIR